MLERQAPDGTGYSIRGKGPVLVLLHGLGLDREMWQAQCDALSDSFAVIAIDAFGHGLSPAPPPELTLQHLVHQVVGVLDHAEVERAVVAGFDLGGQTALAISARAAQRVAGVALISTAYRRLKAQRDMLLTRIDQARRHGPAANADSAIQRWFSAAFQGEERTRVRAIRDRIASNDPSGYIAASQLYAYADVETADDVRNIRAPMLVMCGALDAGSTPAMARRLASAVPGSKLMIVPRQGHMLPIEAATVVNDALINFMNCLSGPQKRD
ncbi:MAG: alpha/beta fold hydrolase [Chromatiales bacterium]|nr:alpha/beta fold hydrolase [Chromatiales bacterium]